MAYTFNPFTGNFDYFQPDTSSASVGSQYDVQLSNGAGGFYGDASFSWDYTTYTMSLGVEDSVATIKGADATGSGSGNGVSLRISPGLPAGGDVGVVSIYDPVNDFNAYLIPDPSGDFSYQFPRKSGVFAMTSDIPAAGANVALSNLASVAINTSLISDTDTTDDLGSTSVRWRAIYGNNGNFIAPLTTVTVPAFTGASGVNWTFNSGAGAAGTGWATPLAGTLDKNVDGTATMTPTGTFTITTGVTYKVVITLSARTAGGATYTLGGVVGSTLQAATTYTDFITAGSTGKIIITPSNTSRFTISSITVQAMTDANGDLRVDGNLNVYSTSNFYAPIKMVGTNALAYSTNGSNWFVGGAGGSLNHGAGAFANVGVGVNVLSNAGIGAANCAVGGNALGQGLTGHDNLAFGAYAGWFTTDGFDNCFFGSSAGVVNTSGSRNTWIGREAGGTNATTYYGVAIGYQAAGGFGASALALGTATSGLVCVGVTSGRDLTSGTMNTMLGYNTGRGVTTGTGNTIIGAQVTGLGTTLTNNIILAIGTGVTKLQYNTAGDWVFTGGSILPSANDAVILGAAGTAFSDLFLAEGGVINWDSSDVTITQTGNVLAFAGATTAYTFDAPVRFKNYTVATLPAGTQGDKAFVTDALGPTYLVTVVGGGAVVTEVFYNGTNWVCT